MLYDFIKDFGFTKYFFALYTTKERKIPEEEFKQVIPDLDEYTKVF